MAATVGAVMTTPVIGMGVGTDVVDVVTAMLDDRVRSIPITWRPCSLKRCPE